MPFFQQYYCKHDFEAFFNEEVDAETSSA